MPLSQHMGVLDQPEPLNLVLLALLWRLHHTVIAEHLLGLQLQALPRGWRMGLKIPSFKPWFHLSGTLPHPEAIQEPTRKCLIRTEDTPVTQEIPRSLGALSGSRSPANTRTKGTPSYHIRNYKGFRSSARNQGRLYVFFHICALKTTTHC